MGMRTARVIIHELGHAGAAFLGKGSRETGDVGRVAGCACVADARGQFVAGIRETTGGTAYALFQVPSQHTIIRLALNHCPVGLLWAQGTIFGSIAVRSSG